MKKIMILATAAFLITGVSFAGNGGDKGKTKDKGKKSQTCSKGCPGKECGKKKG